MFQQIARFNDGPIAFTNRQSYGRRLLDLQLRAIALSINTHIEDRCDTIGNKCRHPSPLVASTGQASDPIRRVATLLSPVFLLNSRHPLFCDTLPTPIAISCYQYIGPDFLTWRFCLQQDSHIAFFLFSPFCKTK